MEQKKQIDYDSLEWFDCKNNFPPMNIDLYVDSEHGYGIGRLGKRVKDSSIIWVVHLDSGEVYLVYAFYKVKRWAYMPKDEKTNTKLKHELKAYIAPTADGTGLADYYLKSEADKVIAGLKARTAELEALNHDLCERVTENDEIRLHWEEIEQTRAENERMKARIAELEEERRWRKFPDEKPEWGNDVLVIDKDGDIHIVRFSHDFKWISWGKMNTCESDCITHWMPLPKGPEDK